VPREYDPAIDVDQDRRTMAIGLATLRLDGFASVGASYDGGSLTTTPAILAGDTLSLNVKADYGRVVVELLDESGTAIDGFGDDDCLPVEVDGVDVPIAWRQRSSLRSLAGRPVQLRFQLYNARLYAYRCR
jgi:hypothetical protein